MKQQHKQELHIKSLLIEKLKNSLAVLPRGKFGASSESLDQLGLLIEEMELEHAEATASMSAFRKALTLLTASNQPVKYCQMIYPEWILCMLPNEKPRRWKENWLFAGSYKGDHRAATIYSLIETAKLN